MNEISWPTKYVIVFGLTPPWVWSGWLPVLAISPPMRCVQCGSLKDKVLDSRSSKDGTSIRRRRECLRCTYRYTTYEQIERTELRVMKRDSTREALNR